MKKINIIYWISTVIILLLMLWSAVSSFIPNPQGEKMAQALGYQPYVFHFLAVAKILGIIAILTPGFPRLKEWAYAGFTFDMLGAAYSMFATGSAFGPIIGMAVFLAILAVSYIYYHKKLAAKGIKEPAV